MIYSVQRELILNYVRNSCEYPTAETIYYDIRKLSYECVKSGKIYDIFDTFDERIKDIEKKTGYTIVSHNLYYNGICDWCR